MWICVQIAYQTGYISAYELSEVNIDVNYSPVIDINHNKNNNLLRDRTFGDNVNSIISLASEYIKGSLDAGILPVLKHFPGHGRVITDSHTEECFSDAKIDELFDTDILPFKILHERYAKANLPIMTNHISYKNIDKFIATYSEEWLVRQSSLIFLKKPFFISDDIEMFSATHIDGKKISCEKRVLLALKAGCRMIIATTMQDNKVIKNKASPQYFEKNYLTDDIIKYFEKIHDKMTEIVIPQIINKSRKRYDEYLENMKQMGL